MNSRRQRKWPPTGGHDCGPAAWDQQAPAKPVARRSTIIDSSALYSNGPAMSSRLETAGADLPGHLAAVVVDALAKAGRAAQLAEGFRLLGDVASADGYRRRQLKHQAIAWSIVSGK